VGVPETRYAKAPDGTSIAYQVVGDGPVDLVYANGIWSNVDEMWDVKPWRHFLERLASFSRLIPFDMRGVGVSDRGPEQPTIELMRDDIAAVLDAVGVDDAVVFAVAGGCGDVDAVRRHASRADEGARPLRAGGEDGLVT
jgi:pimeloyl-ACP methyl ester carboxylesterase